MYLFIGINGVNARDRLYLNTCRLTLYTIVENKVKEETGYSSLLMSLIKCQAPVPFGWRVVLQWVYFVTAMLRLFVSAFQNQLYQLLYV